MVIGDSGATVSITGLRRIFKVLFKLCTPVPIIMGKGRALATHIGIVEWNFPVPGRNKDFYTIPEYVLYCEDFKHLTILSVAVWTSHPITYIQSGRMRCLVYTGKLIDTSNNKALVGLATGDLTRFRVIEFSRAASGLTVASHHPSASLPHGSTRTSFLTGKPYSFSHEHIDRLTQSKGIDATVREEIMTTAHHAMCTVLLNSVSGAAPVKYVDFYHGRGTVNDVEEQYQLPLLCVGGYDNSGNALSVWRKRNPGAVSLESCDDPRVTQLITSAELAIMTPPCQPFSLGGTMRGSTVHEGRHLVECLLPQLHMSPSSRTIMDLLETVPGVLIMPELEVLLDQYQRMEKKVLILRLKASDYGCSSERERLFFISTRTSEVNAFPNAYAKMEHELRQLPRVQSKKVIDIIDHPLIRPESMLRGLDEYFSNSRTFPRDHTGSMKIGHHRSLRLEDDLLSAYGMANVVRAKYASWYMVWLPDWLDLHGLPVGSADRRYVIFQMTAREAARAMDIDDSAPIGDEFGNTASHLLVGNGIPVKLLHHVLAPLVWFLQIVQQGYDITPSRATRRVHFSDAPRFCQLALSDVPVTRPPDHWLLGPLTPTDEVNIDQLLRSDNFNDKVTAAATATRRAAATPTSPLAYESKPIVDPEHPDAYKLLVPPSEEELSYLPFRLDYRYIRMTRETEGWKPMMSPSDPRFPRKVYEVSWNHRQRHLSKRKMEQAIKMQTRFRYPMDHGDSRYLPECPWCAAGGHGRNRMRSRSRTHGAERDTPLSGTHVTMDTQDLGGARSNHSRAHFGNHRYSINFTDLHSELTISFPTASLDHRAIYEAIRYYRHFALMKTGRRLRVLYTDLAPAHYEKGLLADYRMVKDQEFEMEAVSRGEHEQRGLIERKNDWLIRHTRINLMAFIGYNFKGTLLTKANVGILWNLAYHRAVFDYWHTPTDIHVQRYQDYRTPMMVFCNTDTPPDLSNVYPFGEACLHYPKLPNERHNLTNPWLPARYLFPAAYSPFNYKMIHIRPGVTIIDHNFTLQVTSQLKFSDGTSWQVKMADQLAQNSNDTLLPGSANHTWDAATQAWLRSTPTATPAMPPPARLEPAVAPPPTREEAATEPVPETQASDVVHDPDPIDWDSLYQHSPPYRIRLGPKGMRGKSGDSAVRFELYRGATNVSEYQMLHPKGAFDRVDGKPVWRPRRPGERVVSWKSEFRNDIEKGIFRLVDPRVQQKINARFPDAAAEFAAEVSAELSGAAVPPSGGGDESPVDSATTSDTDGGSETTSSRKRATLKRAPISPNRQNPLQRGVRRSARLRRNTDQNLFSRVLDQSQSAHNNTVMQRCTLLLALGHAVTHACGWQGPVHNRTSEMTLHNMYTTEGLLEELEKNDNRPAPEAPEMTETEIRAILDHFSAERQKDAPTHPDDEFSVPTNTAADRRRALKDATYWKEHDWTEEMADLIAFNMELNAISLNIVTRDQISITTDKLIEVKKIQDQEERRLASLAVLKEIQQLCDLGTFELVDKQPGDSKPIGSRLVLKVKYKADGAYDKHKARLVALGYQQRPGFDFFGTFSPMASLTTVRLILAHAIEHGLPVYHSDIPNAFCQGNIDVKNINFQFPTGIDVEGHNENTVLRLVKSLYGLKQAPQTFFKLINQFLKEKLGFKAATTDTCLFYHYENGKTCFICSEVDDLVITGSNLEKIEEVKHELKARFVVGDQKFDFGPIRSFLGIDIEYNYNYETMAPAPKPSCTLGVAYKIHKMFTDQPTLMKLLKSSSPCNVPSHSSDEKPWGDSFNMFVKEYGHHCNVAFQYEDLTRERAQKGLGFGVFNLLARGKDAILRKADYSMFCYLKEHYRSIVGSLIYIMITCRPDLCFSIGKLSRHMHDPQEQHIEWLKRVLRYTHATMDDRLHYTSSQYAPAHAVFDEINNGRAEFSCLVGFTDANHANAREAERKSLSGFCYFLHGNLICWKSKVQPITAASTHAAELIALSFCADEGLWMRNLLNEVGITQPSPTPILCDNQGTVFTSHNPVIQPGSKHLDIRYFRVRQHINARLIDVVHCRTNENLADFFTKSLAFPQFDLFRNILMNSTTQLRGEWASLGKATRERMLNTMPSQSPSPLDASEDD